MPDSTSARTLFERLAAAHHAGHPEARTRLVRLYEYLAWQAAHPRSDDPTPDEIDRFRTPRIAPAYEAFIDAIDEIGKPDFRPEKDYWTYTTNHIRHGIARAMREDKYDPARPSARTKTRLKEEGKHIMTRHHMPAGNIVDPHTDNWLDDARERLCELRLSAEERKVITMLAAGWKRLDVAPALNMSERRVTRIKSRVRAMLTQ